MRYKLFLDDERYPPNKTIYDYDWRIARNYHDAVWYVETHGLPYHISFDHDLGKALTGFDFMKWLCEHIMDNELKLPDDFTYTVHSMNPIGALKIHSYMANFIKDGYVP